VVLPIGPQQKVNQQTAIIQAILNTNCKVLIESIKYYNKLQLFQVE